MNATDIAKMLFSFQGMWPYFEILDQTPGLWLNACFHIEQSVGAEATEKCLRELERPPSAKVFLDYCKAVKRAHTPTYAGAIGPGSRAPYEPSAAQRIGAIRAYWAEAGKDRPAHDHHRGDKNCPRCSTAGEFIREHAPELVAILKETPPMQTVRSDTE